MKKHAFLIMAHKDDLTFRTLLSLLDDRRNDIFIHMDKKVKEYSLEEVKSHIKFSNVYHAKRTNVTWGGYSQINAELELLKSATKTGNYQYYHLLSGEDLPIKTQDVIHETFDLLNGTECVSLAEDQTCFTNRGRYFFFFQEIIGRKETNTLKPIRKLESISLKLQKSIGFKRGKRIKYWYGANWFSITDCLARFVVNKRKWIHKQFFFTRCCDETFLQTLVMNSHFKDCVNPGGTAEAILRLIDWERGTPYVFQNTDYEILKNSKMLFARKFCADMDKEIITSVKEMISK